MKKIISVLLALTMIFSLGVIGVSAEEAKELTVTVANDLHYSGTGNVANSTTIYKEDFANSTGTGQLRLESELIIDEFLNRVATDVVLLPGDITDNGTEAEHAYMAEKLEKFEAATGKKVFLIPGNHDYMQHRGGKMTADKIKANYFALCYDEAITVDTETASYVADLDGEYRLLAIDATKPGANQNHDERLFSWIEAQLKAAKADGKKVIAMSHYNLMEHFIFMDKLHAGSVLTSSMNLPELFAQYNVKVTFTGHSHEQDIKAYTGSNGNTIYDAVTNSINAYPCAYREVAFGEKIKFETKFVDKIDTTLLKGRITDATYELATEDFLAYARELYCLGVIDLVEGYIDADSLIRTLGLDKEKDAELCSILYTVIPRAAELLYMPIYKADEAEEGKSIEAILSQYNITLPETEYATIKDLAIDVYLAHVLGDENTGLFSDKFSLITSCFTAIFYYALDGISGEQYAQLLSFACTYLGANISVDFFKYAGSGIKKAEGIDLFITAVLTPLLLEITTDEGTPDNNVTLNGYGAEYNAPAITTAFDKFINLLKDFFAYILRILGF